MPPGSDDASKTVDGVIGQGQVVRSSDAGRSSTDNGHLAAGLGGRDVIRWQVSGVAIALLRIGVAELILRVGPHGLDSVLLGYESLERTNRDRRVN